MHLIDPLAEGFDLLAEGGEEASELFSAFFGKAPALFLKDAIREVLELEFEAGLGVLKKRYFFQGIIFFV
jgi:hypothetical protein